MFGLFGKGAASMPMQEAKTELARNKDIVLIDVRNTDEYAQGHIAGSINIPLHILPALLPEKVPARDAKIFVYCLSGSRSSQASRWMAGNGYTNVTNIGGISAWNGPIARN